MEGRRRALGEGNGPLDAAVMFVAEAPGRLGAERTGVPLTGDQSGRNFARLLAEAGIDRSRIFVTNAVLCNPRSSKNANRPPSCAEITNCSGHLRAQLDLVGAPVVVSLGAVALYALGLIEPHGCVQRTDVGQPISWRGRLLVPLYHPGPQAMLHRPFARQIEDYRVVGALAGFILPTT
jgi:uracil-DNA glycosylase family 4